MTVQDLLSDFRTFIGTGYFSCVFGLISSTVCYLQFRWVFHTFGLCFISAEERFLTYRFDF